MKCYEISALFLRSAMPTILTLLISLIGCGKSAPASSQKTVEGDHANPALPLFHLPEMADRLFELRTIEKGEALIIRDLTDNERIFMKDLWDKRSSSDSADEMNIAVSKRTQYGTVKVGDEVTLICQDASWPSRIVGFMPSDDDLYEQDVVLAALAPITEANGCSWALHGARLPAAGKPRDIENLVARPESAPVLEAVRHQLVERSTGLIRSELQKLNIANPKYITYVRASFPGAIDGIVIIERAPVERGDEEIEQMMNAVLFVDKTGRIVLTHSEPSLGDCFQTSTRLLYLVDLDKDGLDEFAIDEYYAEGGYIGLHYWENGLPKYFSLGGGGL